MHMKANNKALKHKTKTNHNKAHCFHSHSKICGITIIQVYTRGFEAEVYCNLCCNNTVVAREALCKVEQKGFKTMKNVKVQINVLILLV